MDSMDSEEIKNHPPSGSQVQGLPGKYYYGVQTINPPHAHAFMAGGRGVVNHDGLAFLVVSTDRKSDQPKYS